MTGQKDINKEVTGKSCYGASKRSSVNRQYKQCGEMSGSSAEEKEKAGGQSGTEKATI